MGRYRNVKVITFSKDININELGPEFQLFDTKVMQSDGNNVTLVGYEYYKPSYRTCFRRIGRNNRNNRNQSSSSACMNSGFAKERSPENT